LTKDGEPDFELYCHAPRNSRSPLLTRGLGPAQDWSLALNLL